MIYDKMVAMKHQNFYHALRKHHNFNDGLRSLTGPIVEAFNLAQFCYFSVDSNGNTAALSTYPDWMEYYINEELFVFNPFLKSPKLIPEGVYLARGINDSAYLHSRKHAESFGIQDSLVITLKLQNKLVGFSFGLKSDIHQHPFIIKEIPLLRNYGEFFLKEASRTIRELESEPINILPFNGVAFERSHVNFGLSNHKNDKLLRLMGVAKSSLSSREKECLRFYLKGETASSIAKNLGLSRRTVESYLGNIKIKLNSHNKTDLLKHAKQLLDCGLLSP